ncbi:MAG: [NiFe]-hydrogenase assembly chaperone HybE, partial [Gammaproteobacteria bacterium]
MEERIRNLVSFHSRVAVERMRDLPIFNERLEVEPVGFREFDGRLVGILISPW